MKLVPVEHDPFAADPLARQITDIRTELKELVSRVNSFGHAAEQIDTALHADLRNVAEAINAVGNYFNDSLNAIRDDLAGAPRAKGAKATSGKVATDLGALRDQIGDFGKAVTSKLDAMQSPAKAVAVKIVRDSSGKPIKISKGGKVFDIERRDGHIVGIVPEGQSEPPPPKRPNAMKRYG